MNTIEATSNIVIALINNHFISSPDDIVEAYQKIYKVIRNPHDN